MSVQTSVRWNVIWEKSLKKCLSTLERPMLHLKKGLTVTTPGVFNIK